MKRNLLTNVITNAAGNIVCALALLLSFTAVAQVTPAWISRYNGPGSGTDAGTVVKVDASGNVYVAGRAYIGNQYDVVLVKYDANGNVLWEKFFTGTQSGTDYVRDMKLDNAGNPVLVGYARSSTSYDYFTVKYDANGNKLWYDFYNNTTSTDYGYGMDIDGSNNIYVTGYSYSGTSTGYDVVTIKYTPGGSRTWVRKFSSAGNRSDYGYSVAVNSSGDVFVGGRGYQNTTTGYDGLVIKYNSGGTLQWSKWFNDTAYSYSDNIQHVVADNHGNVYATGYVYTGKVTLSNFFTVKLSGSGTELWRDVYDGEGINGADQGWKLGLYGDALYALGSSDTTPTRRDFMTIKYDTSNGNIQWDKRKWGQNGTYYDYPQDLDFDGSGNIYVAGYFYKSSGSYNYALVKYSPAGANIWTKDVNGPGNSSDQAFSVAVTSAGTAYITGQMYTGTDYDMATVKFTSAGAKVWTRYYNAPGAFPDEGRHIAVDASGNVYITGQTYRNTNPNITTVKYDPNGNQIWVESYDNPGTNSYDEPKGIGVDNSGNVYVVGITVNSSGNSDLTTIKYNSAGNQQWVKKFDGGKNDDAADIEVHPANGDVYVTGYTTVNDTNYDYITIKYNSGGTSQWTKTYNNPANNSYDYPAALALDATNSFVYVTGSSFTSTLYDIATVKYAASNGAQSWVKLYDGASNLADNGKDVQVDNAGNVYVAGRSRIGPNYDYITIKYDASGNKLWDTPFNYIGFDDPKALAVHDATGDVYVVGTSAGGATGDDIATVKFDSNGNQKWVKRYNGPGSLADNPGGIVVDGAGNAYITGQMSKTPTDLDYVTISYNPNGVVLWEHFYDAGSNEADQGNGITIDASDVVYVTGASYDNITNYDYGTIKFCIASAGADTSICEGESLTLQATGGSGYTWTPATGLSCTNCANPVASPTTTTSYVVTATNGLCAGNDTITVTVLPVPTPNTSADVGICPGSNTQLSASGGTSYKWSPATGLSNSAVANPLAFPTVTTVYTVTVTNGVGCTIASPITVSVSPFPNVNAGTGTTICSGDSAQLSGSGAAGSYIWNPPGGLDNPTLLNPMASPFFTTTYTLTVIDGTTGCNNTDTVTINVQPAPTSFAGIDTNICQGAAVTFGSLAPGGTSYTWTPPTGLSCTNCIQPIGTPSTTTTYTFVVGNGFCFDTSMVTITVDTIPAVSAGPDDTICGPGNSAVLVATGGSSYTWSPATGLSCTNCPSPIATLNNTTTYTVTAASTSNCPNSDEVTINVAPGANPSIAQNITQLQCSPSFASYQWYLNGTGLAIPGATAQNYTFTQNGTYYVIVTDAWGCTGIDSIVVVDFSIGEDPNISMMNLYPNPNNGRFSIGFTISNSETYLLSVVNMLGQPVFSEQLQNYSGIYHKDLDLSNHGSGVYLVNLRSETHQTIYRVTINR